MSNRFPEKLNEILHEGVVIPANPTALTKELKLDERRQRALSRYYLEAGSGGLAKSKDIVYSDISLKFNDTRLANNYVKLGFREDALNGFTDVKKLVLVK